MILEIQERWSALVIQVIRDMVDTIAYTPRGARAWQQETLGETSE